MSPSIPDQAFGPHHLDVATGFPATQLASTTENEANAYIVEVRGQTVGIVARDGQFFRFHASSHRFNTLDGRRFKSPREAERAAIALTRPASRPRRLAAAAGALALLSV